MKYSRIIGTALAVFALAAPATASPITYTEEGTGSGTLDGTPFTNSLVEITVVGDTNNIGNPSPPMFINQFFQNPCVVSAGICVGPTATATVTVTGVAMTDTLPKIVVQENQSALEAGFFAPVGGGVGVLFTKNSAFAGGSTYGLGPIVPTSGPLGFDTALVASYATGSGGTFNITWSLANNSTFTATSAAPETPLPAAFPLFATGLGALGLLGWRRKRRAKAVA